MDLKRKELEALIHRSKALLHTYNLLEEAVPEIEVVSDRLIVHCYTMNEVFDVSRRISDAIGWSSNKVVKWASDGVFYTSFKDDRNDLVAVWLVS